ncbi:uncharacterized protein DEA37_0009785 [Paragonimus westermani]|uniref:Uncharacterized protein n=1 Tax=Paragonimus westermani TaxID=34504 RepID=A0A5J4NY93_9TREM|nr:uncharacterized protein DEA37_0009785 [Paragonimus westermani]
MNVTKRSLVLLHQVTHMNVILGQLQVSNTMGNAASDFEIVLEYETGLSNTVNLSENITLTCGAGALLSETLWIGVLNVKVKAKPLSKFTLNNCPATVRPGDVIYISLSAFLPFANGDYSAGTSIPTIYINTADAAVSSTSSFRTNTVNLLFATVNIKPEARSTYQFDVSTTQTPDLLRICAPRLLNFDKNVGFYTNPAKITGNKILVELGFLYHDGKSIRTHGHNTTYSLSNAKTPTLLPALTDAGLLDTFDYNKLSTRFFSSSLAPGETIQIFYKILIRNTMCVSYTIHIINNNDDTWPVELGTAFVQAYGESVWCIDTQLTSALTPG